MAVFKAGGTWPEVNNCGDEGNHGGYVGFDKGRGEGVKGACGGFHFVDYVLNLSLGDVSQAAERLGDHWQRGGGQSR